VLDLFAVGCRCLVAVVFVLSVSGKVCSRTAFAGFVGSVGTLVPRWRGRRRSIAAGVVAVETVIVVLLAVPATARVAAALAAVVLLGFTTAIVAALRRGSTASCRCFGASTVQLGRRHVVRNGLLLAAVAVATAIDQVPSDPAWVVLAVIAGVIGGVLVALFDELVDLFAAT
jgi:uncharacterized membrane protein YphA (DoxX/SURF4 family)